MLVHSGSQDSAPLLAQSVDATLCWLHPQPLERRRPYLIKHTTREVKIAFDDIAYRVDVNTLDQHTGVETLAMNDIARVKLRLHQPLICDAYDDNRATGAFIVIDPASNATVAAGMIAST